MNPFFRHCFFSILWDSLFRHCFFSFFEGLQALGGIYFLFLMKFHVAWRQNHVWGCIFDPSYDHIYKNVYFCKGWIGWQARSKRASKTVLTRALAALFRCLSVCPGGCPGTSIYLHIPPYTFIYLHIPLFTFIYPQISWYTFIYSHIPHNIQY